MTKISVIIPVYNVSEYLEKCLWSVTNQTLQDIEIIVVNDGSTDNSLSVITNYAKKDNRIKIINKKNEGVVLARKEGLKIAAGSYIHYLDGDDYMELNSYELLYNKATAANADILIFEFIGTENKAATPDFKSNIDFINYNLATGRYFSLGLNIHKKELYNNEINYRKELTMFEDSYLGFQLAYYARRISYTENYLYNYVMRVCSITNIKISDKKANDMLLQPKLLVDFFKDKPQYDHLEEELFGLYVKADAQLYWKRYFTKGCQRSKESMDKIKKYPEIKFMEEIRPLYKLIKIYALNPILGRLFAQYYIIKKKIK